MKLIDFIKESEKTALYPYRGQYGGLTYVICGLAGELGELFEVLKKIIRDEGGLITDTSRIKSETGDLLWYWSQLLYELGSKFQDDDKVDADVIQKDLYKLYLGRGEKPDISNVDFIYHQREILSHCHVEVSGALSNLGLVQNDGDFNEIFKNIQRNAINLFKFLCFFLSNLDIQMSEVMQINLDKLSKRKEAGKLRGSGEDLDERG